MSCCCNRPYMDYDSFKEAVDIYNKMTVQEETLKNLKIELADDDTPLSQKAWVKVLIKRVEKELRLYKVDLQVRGIEL